MTHQEFKDLCEREWANGFGEVKELHLDEGAYTELVQTVRSDLHRGLPAGMKVEKILPIKSVMNEITGNYVEIVRHENHAVVERPPQPPPTTHIVRV